MGDEYAAAEAAARAGDEDRLAEILSELGDRGWMWGLLETRAWKCVERKELAVGLRLLQAIIEGPSPSLTAWNNWAWAVAALPASERASISGRPITPETCAPWLEKALAHGPMNLDVFHNVACAAVALGLRDLALRAVEGAAKHRSERLAAMRKDEHLRPIMDDPRFQAALTAKTAIGLAELEASRVELPLRGQRHLVHRPVLAMTFHFAGTLEHVAPSMGALLDAYRADLPPQTLGFYKRGAWKPLTKAMITRERKSFDAVPAGRDHLAVRWRSTDGDAAEYDFEADGDADHSTVTLTFPIAEAETPEPFVERFARYAALASCESAHAGFDATNRENDAYEGISWNRVACAERFMGFQHASTWWAPGRAPPAHWLVWLSAPLVKQLGGLRRDLGAAVRTEVEGNVLLRAARRPPIAPVDDPSDRGAIPDVSRALRPLRIAARGDANVAKLARWDELPGAAYENW